MSINPTKTRPTLTRHINPTQTRHSTNQYQQREKTNQIIKPNTWKLSRPTHLITPDLLCVCLCARSIKIETILNKNKLATTIHSNNKKNKVHLISFTIKLIFPIDTLHQFPKINQA